MSKQLIVDYLPFEVTREQINESIKQNNGRLVVHGVLQRSDAKNQMVEFIHTRFWQENPISMIVNSLNKKEQWVS